MVPLHLQSATLAPHPQLGPRMTRSTQHTPNPPRHSITQASTTTTLLLNLCPPANQVDIVPGLTQTLLSGSKLADAGCHLRQGRSEFLQLSHNPHSGKVGPTRLAMPTHWVMAHPPLVLNQNTDTLLLDAPGGTTTTNPQFKIHHSWNTLAHLQTINTPDTLASVYELPSIAQAVRYLHGAAGFPTKSTWLAAIHNGNYSTWPLINVKKVTKHFPESEETQQGHMCGQRQGVRSTKPTGPNSPRLSAPTPLLDHIEDILVNIHDNLYSDQTGKFPHISSRGNRYHMILYHVNSNSIWVEAPKNRSEGEIIFARTLALQRMKVCDLAPTRQVLDNEASAAYKQAIHDSGMTYQLVPPDNHRRNLAEKAIQTWKDQFIATLSGTAEKFPLHLWCQTLPQMERQLNLLQQSCVHPKLSAYAHLYGHHDYNALPFVPIGMEALVHNKPHWRKSFAQHCSNGWVLGTLPEHYRCWTVWTIKTRTTLISASVFFKHKYITTPTVTPADAIIAAAANLVHALKTNIPVQHLGATTLHDLQRLQDILQNASAPLNATPSPPLAIVKPSALPPRVAPLPAPTLPQEDNDSEDDNPSPHRTIRQHTPSPRVSLLAAVNPPAGLHSPPALNTRSKSKSLAQHAILLHLQRSHPHLSARHMMQRCFPSNSLAAVLNDDTGELMEYRHLIANPKYRDTWTSAYGKELGRLAQGLPGTVAGTNTIVFISKCDIPSDRWRDVTYGRIVANFRPKKDDPHSIQLTVGGNHINFPGDCGIPIANLLTTKDLLNSVVSTVGARFMTIDIKDFYLNTPMARPEFMPLKLSNMPNNIIEHYALHTIATEDGFVYIGIQKGMYILPQAGIIAQQLLEKRLAAEGYHQSTITPSYWKHDWRPTSFALCVDDFGVKYVGRGHANHLLKTLNTFYQTSQDWNRTRYLGLTIAWDYTKRRVSIYMPGYCSKAKHHFHHIKPLKRQDQPYPHTAPTYGAAQQYTHPPDTSPPLSKPDALFVKEVIGVFLYYARAVDCTMLAALGSLAAQQANPTQLTLSYVKHFLDYAASHPDARVPFHASDVVLAVHSDALYLSKTKARSRADGRFFMSTNDVFPPNNGAVLTISQIIKVVMSSAAEAELVPSTSMQEKPSHYATF
eukprot:CCRYP_000381-RA/>CCRYP_000381-RA protein AED:0.13 eAED:0.11 QI:0/0/0/1/0.33/0.25/4/0/1130